LLIESSFGDPIRSGLASISSIAVSTRVSDVATTAGFRFGGIRFLSPKRQKSRTVNYAHAPEPQKK
jgi:hypothetical protein